VCHQVPKELYQTLLSSNTNCSTPTLISLIDYGVGVQRVSYNMPEGKLRHSPGFDGIAIRPRVAQ